MHTAICKYCNNSIKDPKIEWNFSEEAVYCYCPECKKMNKMDLKQELKPFPKSRRMR